MSTHTTQMHRPSPTLEKLLVDELAFSPSIQGIYSNHLAMALVALDQMGASAESLETTFARHSSSNEAERRDDTADLEERRDEVRRLGIAETVRRRLPDLVTAPSSALFHPAIRLAYALDIDHEDQVAAALLDWEKRLHVLPVPDSHTGSKTLFDVAAELAAYPSGTWDGSYDLHGVARRRELADALDGVDFEHVTLYDVAEFALAVHVAADAFVSLHMVTGARAIHRVAELLDDDEDIRRLTIAAAKTMAVLHAVVGAPRLPTSAELDRIRNSAPSDRDEIAQRAIANGDAHVIKLANVALVEEERTGDPLYRFIAARVVELG